MRCYCPIIVFCLEEVWITNSFQQMAKQYTTTLKSKEYLVGKLANVIWGDDWDVKYFVDNSTKMSFGKLIHNM
jgi:hypothetical protein